MTLAWKTRLYNAELPDTSITNFKAKLNRYSQP